MRHRLLSFPHTFRRQTRCEKTLPPPTTTTTTCHRVATSRLHIYRLLLYIIFSRIHCHEYSIIWKNVEKTVSFSFPAFSMSLLFTHTHTHTLYYRKTYCCNGEIECFITVLHYRKGYADVVISVVNIRKIIQTVIN